MLEKNNFSVGDETEIDFSYRHPNYKKMYANWIKNRDFVRGVDFVKTRTYEDLHRYSEEVRAGIYDNVSQQNDAVAGTAYLPIPEGMKNEIKRYRDYRDRAQLYNASGTTHASFMGMLYRKAPVFQYEPSDEDTEDEIKDKVLKKVTPNNKSFVDLCREVSSEVIITNKVGILVDFPAETRDKEFSVLEFEEMNLTPKAAVYPAESIINWHTILVNDEEIPDYYVLDESAYVLDEESMEYVWEERYRILYLEDNKRDFVYHQLLVGKKVTKTSSTQRSNHRGKFEVIDFITPMKNNKTLNRLPFYVIDKSGLNYGETNESMINDLVDVNMGHYRNSADLEHNLYFLGMKTLILKGWDEEVNGVPTIGGIISGGTNFEADLLEPKSDSGIEKEMQNKEMRMSVLGAQAISQRGKYVQSAATAKINSASETSILSALAYAQSNVMSTILNLILGWSGYDNTRGNININTDFFDDLITPDSVLTWTQLKQSGGISPKTWYYNLEKRDVFPPDWSLTKEQNSIEEAGIPIMDDLIYKNTPLNRPNAVAENTKDILDVSSNNRKFESKPDEDESSQRTDSQEFTV